jgi:hypothetical protein
LPTTIDRKYLHLAAAKDDRALYEGLLGNRSELSHFMIQAARDETWSSAHPEFFKSALTHLSQSFFGGRLEFALAQEIVQCLYEHHDLLHKWAPESVHLVQGDQVFAINPLYLAVRSPYFLQRMRTESGGKERRLAIDSYPADLVVFVMEYFKTKDFRDLFRFSEGELAILLSMTEAWEISELKEAIEKRLIKYIPTEKVEAKIIEAISARRMDLAQGAVELFNRTKRGARLFFDPAGRLGIEFFDLDERTVASFEKLRSHLGCIQCKTDVIQEEEFENLVRSVPQLEAMDFSESESYPPILEDLPRSIRELDCSRCIWLDNRKLEQLSKKWEGVEVLCLRNNSELNYSGFVNFHYLKRLKLLDISRCHHLKESDREMIRSLVPDADLRGP